MQIPDQIEREVVIDAPVQRVWALITEAEHLGTWFGDAGAEVDLRPGGEMRMSWEEYGTVHARVERVEPERLFSYRWAPFQDPGGKEPVEGNSTLVEFTLAEEGGGTRVRVVESGFGSLDASDEQRLAVHGENVEGWQMELGHLVEHAARVTA
jgi:uncharacterized protein YndB with AHSA1/START domain